MAHTDSIGQHANASNIDNFDQRSHEREDTLKPTLTADGSFIISPELFEKIYLSPQNKVKNQLRETFGNPTPMYGSYFDIPVSNELIVG